MELTKNIFFNTDKLVQGCTVKISYTGTFFQNNSSEVYIHYGFGLLWENVGEVRMEKTELGFQADIQLSEHDTFNFCFRNEDNEWDNNEGNNYIFPIEHVQTDLVKVEEQPTSIIPARKLRKTYIWSKKIKLAIYKIITYVPKIISGNYKRKIKE